MIYFIVIEPQEADYTRGEENINLYEAPNGVFNCIDENMFECETIEEAIEHFSLKESKKFAETKNFL